MNDYLLLMNARFGQPAHPTFNSVTVPQNEKRYPNTLWFGKKFFGNTPFSELLLLKRRSYFKNFPDYSHYYNRSLRERIGKLDQSDIDILNKARTGN
jgi:hypothetical protein